MGDSGPDKAMGSLASKVQQGSKEGGVSTGLLQTLESSLDDIRSLVICRVCVRPLFEPYTIECGHTFCYGCLAQWFEKDRFRKSCPDCRADVIRQPAPAYLVGSFRSAWSELSLTRSTGQGHDTDFCKPGRAHASW